jgi:hypothetical protein
LDQRHQVARLTWYFAQSWAAVARAPGMGRLGVSVLRATFDVIGDFSKSGKTEGVGLQVIGNSITG